MLFPLFSFLKYFSLFYILNVKIYFSYVLPPFDGCDLRSFFLRVLPYLTCALLYMLCCFYLAPDTILYTVKLF